MNKIRLGLALATCAIAPLAFTGCTGDDKNKQTATAEALATPVPVADKLNKSLAELGVRVRTVDEALNKVVSESATDPEERIFALDKAVRDIGPLSATSLGGDLKATGATIVSGWQANANGISDTELRKVAVAAGDEAKANFDAVESALRKTDEALKYHAALLRDVRAALGARPNATQIVAARSSARRVAEAGKRVGEWCAWSARLANAAGRSPVPGPAPAAATPDPVKVEAVADAPKADVSDKKPDAPKVEVPAPVTAGTPAKSDAPAEPKPKPSEPDPIPEPVK